MPPSDVRQRLVSSSNAKRRPKSPIRRRHVGAARSTCAPIAGSPTIGGSRSCRRARHVKRPSPPYRSTSTFSGRSPGRWSTCPTAVTGGSSAHVAKDCETCFAGHNHEARHADTATRDQASRLRRTRARREVPESFQGSSTTHSHLTGEASSATHRLTPTSPSQPRSSAQREGHHVRRRALLSLGDQTAQRLCCAAILA